MAQARTEYGKVVAPRHFGTDFSSHRTALIKFLMLCMVLFMVVSVFHVWSRCRVLELNFQISENARQVREAEQEQKRLMLEAAALKTPSRIEAIAKNELGMARPRDAQVITVR